MKEGAQAHPRDHRLIDYRNARYQGTLVGGKRDGVGVGIDDDWRVYLGEWKQGKAHGKGIVVLPSGEYVYGDWQEGKMHGTTVFRNKEAVLFMNHHKGLLVGKVMAVADSGQFVVVAWGDGQPLQAPETVRINDISNYHNLLKHMAKKYDIMLDTHCLSVGHFLSYLSTSNPALQLATRDGLTYIGYRNGLGIRFEFKGRLSHRLSLSSIGHHQQQRVDELGIKFHQNRCLEEGNFSTKQTVTYQRFPLRPEDKCRTIQQKAHKRSISFINQYLDVGDGIMGYLIKINQKIQPAMLEQIGGTHDSSQQQKEQVNRNRSGQTKLKRDLSQQQFTRSISKTNNNKSTSELLKLKPVLQEKTKKIETRQSTAFKNIKKDPYLKSRQHSKSASIDKKSRNSPKQNMRRSPTRQKNSPYTEKKTRVPLNPTNTNYIRQAQRLSQEKVMADRKISKNEMQRQNEVKIRVELAQKDPGISMPQELPHQDSHTFMDYLRPPPLPYSPLTSQNVPQHHLSSWQLPSAVSPDPQLDREREHLRELERKREDILQQYRRLNQRWSPTASPPRLQESIYSCRDSPLRSSGRRQFVPAYDEAGVEQFNRRYRNYLDKTDKSPSPRHDFSHSPKVNPLHVYTPSVSRRNKYQYFFDAQR